MLTKTNKVVKEFEAKFLDIDYNDLITKVKSLGGILIQPNTIYNRSMFNLCDIKKGYVRVRDEGNKVTMTSKIYKNPDYPDEYEIEINNDFEKGRAFLQSLNLTETAYHETMREKWNIPLDKTNICEIAIDCIPGIPMYVEVECKSEADLNKSIKMLNMDNSKKQYGTYGKVFNEYYGISQSIINNNVPKLTFNNIKNEIKHLLKKGEDILEKAYKDNIDIYDKIKK